MISFTAEELTKAREELTRELENGGDFFKELREKLMGNGDETSALSKFFAQQHYGIFRANPIAGMLLSPEELVLPFMAILITGVKLGRMQVTREITEQLGLNEEQAQQMGLQPRPAPRPRQEPGGEDVD